jgi:pilus assembly protein CpaE
MVCDPDTKVIIVGAANDITLVSRADAPRRERVSRAADDAAPCHQDDFRSLPATLKRLSPASSLAFIGAKGGVGSSTVAHNVAWQLTDQLRSDAVLVDLDLSFGTAGLDFNQDPPQTIAEALTEPQRLDDALLDRLLVRCNDRLSLFSAPATLESDWDFDVRRPLTTVLDKVRRQTPFVALDLPHAWSPWVRQTLAVRRPGRRHRDAGSRLSAQRQESVRSGSNRAAQ